MENYVTICMPRTQAYEQGLLVCKCGHPTNNHFDHGAGACAHCACGAYREKAKFGSLVPMNRTGRTG